MLPLWSHGVLRETTARQIRAEYRRGSGMTEE
jgi:hypothetical protein